MDMLEQLVNIPVSWRACGQEWGLPPEGPVSQGESVTVSKRT